MGYVWDVEFPTQSQKLLLLKMADHANDEGGSIWPSKETLARKIGASESTIQLCLKVFRNCGLLHVLEAGGNGPRSTTKYAINVELLVGLANGSCSIKGCSDVLEIEGEPDCNKGSDFHPFKGSAGQGVEIRSHQPGDDKGSAQPSKGSAGRPQTFTKNLQEPSLARERAGDIGASAPPAWKNKGLTQHRITDVDVQWNDWLRHLNACNRADLAEAAQTAGEMFVVGSRWPTACSKLPAIPGAGLTEVSKRIIGEGE